jgi:hypothetical protein
VTCSSDHDCQANLNGNKVGPRWVYNPDKSKTGKVEAAVGQIKVCPWGARLSDLFLSRRDNGSERIDTQRESVDGGYLYFGLPQGKFWEVPRVCSWV